ncbi:MAG: hypothetical protein KVP17_002396 [Porospora cf. gigantea B]|uniref:uncharacterized protein n=1 Tax=Porospora cf. gigantea B TaxID=2853592 RepID=UPI003571868C|nr:MAG: hypothetical protein KVP17_002396 [Porospora cf. gigantea B]
MRVDLVVPPLPSNLTTLIGSVLNPTCGAISTLKREPLTVLPDIDMLRTPERALLVPTCDMKSVSQHLASLTLSSHLKPIPPVKELRVKKSTVETLLAGRRLIKEVYRCGSSSKPFVRKTIRIPLAEPAIKKKLRYQTVEEVRAEAASMTRKAQAELHHTMEEGDSDVLLRNWGPVFVTDSGSSVDYNFLQDDGGKCLDDYIFETRMPIDLLLNVAARAAEGLKELRRKNIIHRDVKPANLTVEKNGRVRLIDFDLSISPLFEAYPQPNFAGSLLYAAPETQVIPAESRFVTFASDVWSLGISLVELLCPGGNFDFKYKSVFKDVCAAIVPRLQATVNSRDARRCIIFLILDMLRSDPRKRSTPDEIIAMVADIRTSLSFPSSRGHRSIAHVVEDSPVDYAAVKELLCHEPKAGSSRDVSQAGSSQAGSQAGSSRDVSQ